MSQRTLAALVAAVAVLFAFDGREAHAQAFGVELHNTLMPASGAMGGVSIARPQDVQSAMTNPATLTQFHGTQFGMGGAWVEPTITIDNRATLDLADIDPYEAKSGRPGSALGNIVVTQDFSALGMPITWSAGLLTTTGLGLDYRANAKSNGTSAELLGLAIAQAVGVQVTDRLSLGASILLGSVTLDGPFTETTAATPAYGLRGMLGMTYDLGNCTTLGGYWMTLQSFRFDDAVRVGGRDGPFLDVNLDMPQTFGVGVANNRLLDGRLLLAGDVLYKQWSDTDFFGAIWDDQWIFQAGAQYTTQRGISLRLGYAYAQDATADVLAKTIGGIDPQAGVDYLQALFPNINPHRLSAGVGMRDVLPGIDVDLFGGGMFRSERDYGTTTASVQSYWVGLGLTWRFGRGACQRLPVADHWGGELACK